MPGTALDVLDVELRGAGLHASDVLNPIRHGLPLRDGLQLVDQVHGSFDDRIVFRKERSSGQWRAIPSIPDRTSFPTSCALGNAA